MIKFSCILGLFALVFHAQLSITSARQNNNLLFAKAPYEKETIRFLRRRSLQLTAKSYSEQKRSKRFLPFGGRKCHFKVGAQGIFGFLTCTNYQQCNASEQPCPTWSNWQGQELCSVSCGGGFRLELRYCKHVRPNKTCSGENSRRSPCNLQPCPSWSSWTAYSDCSKSCGTGQLIASRSCIIDSKNTTGCEGPRHKVAVCRNSQHCKPQWSSWSGFSECSLTCGEVGLKRRSRRCLNATNHNSQKCVGSSMETITCLVNKTKASCHQYAPWSSWSQCDAPCGSWAVAQRNRTCFGITCNQELLTDFKLCSSQNCQEPLNISSTILENFTNSSQADNSSWSHWTSCFVQNDARIQLRGRSCTISSTRNLICQRENAEVRFCSFLHITWESWQSWSECFGNCTKKQGVRIRRRQCFKSFSHSATSREYTFENAEKTSTELCNGSYPASYQVSSCETQPCLAHWGVWSTWSSCSSTCGSGYTLSTRKCVGRQNTSDCIGESKMYKQCFAPPCWSDWTTFEPCSASCGKSGFQHWIRKCRGASSLFQTCRGNESERRRCNTHSCPLWSSWGGFGPCSASCGQGRKTKTRECLSGNCEGRNYVDEPCNTQACPTWSAWSLFSCCSTSCGRGAKSRSRTCLNAVPDFAECEGDSFEKRICHSGPCNVTTRITSSFSCGNTTRTRSRKLAVLRISGGKKTSIHNWPWQVSLQLNLCTYGVSEPCWNHICGGTLIAPQWVVSAAHCTKDTQFLTIPHDDPSHYVSVVLGASNIHKINANHRVRIRRIIVHPDYSYDRNQLQNDIALIKLEQPVQISSKRTPACMPSSSPPSDGTVCYATGWGYTENSNLVTSVLREAAIPIVDFQRCRNLGNGFRGLREQFHMCAGNPETGGPDTCNGDSGGPLVCKGENNLWYLAGITSFGLGSRCGTRNFVGVYTPFHQYTSWIQTSIEEYSHAGC